MSKTLINIFGAPRSGTTMLDVMLGNDKESFSLGEIHAWFRPFRTHHFKIRCNCGNPECEYWNKIKHYKESEFHTKAFEELQVNFLIDSSKHLDWMIDNQQWALQNNIKIVNFLIYKPFKEYAHSIWKRGESMNQAFKKYKSYYSRFFDARIPAYSINYRELVEHPESILDKLCNVTGQKSYPKRKNFWEYESHHLFGSGGIRRQLREGETGIKDSTDYQPEFLALWTEFKEKLQHDSSFIKIKDRLEEIELHNHAKSLRGFEDIRKPYWYYYLKVRNIFKSFFPGKPPKS